MAKSSLVRRVKYMRMKLTEDGKYRLEQIRIAVGKGTTDAVVFAAIRELGKKHGIEVPAYTDDDMFRLVRRGLAPSGNVQALKGKNRSADVILPIVGDSKWYDDLRSKLKVATFADVVKTAMSNYDKKHLG